MLCDGCKQPVNSKVGCDCYLYSNSPKTYSQYKKQFCATQKSLLAKYGAPSIAKVPMSKEYLPKSSDSLFRRGYVIEYSYRTYRKKEQYV